MRRKIKFVGVAFVLCAIAFMGLMGLVVSGLWNALMPAIFGLRAITFWQALGILVLSRILFGRFGGWGRGMRKHRFVRGRRDLTPDERERFRRAMGIHRPGSFDEGEATEKS